MQVLLSREAGKAEQVAKSSEEQQRGCKCMQGHSVIEVNFWSGARPTSKPNIVPPPRFCRYGCLYPTLHYEKMLLDTDIDLKEVNTIIPVKYPDYG
jgi:hypothetical protein